VTDIPAALRRSVPRLASIAVSGGDSLYLVRKVLGHRACRARHGGGDYVVASPSKGLQRIRFWALDLLSLGLYSPLALDHLSGSS